jgi:butyrate kinase
MVEYLKNAPLEHASNLGALLAMDIATSLGLQSFIVDPVVVDEMSDEARFTGIPEIRRRSIFHALNQKAVAREAARKLNRRYEDCSFVVAHLGGGISIGAHRKGKVIDVNNALNGDGPFTPERAGSIPAWDLVELALSGKYDKNKIKKMLTGQGGLVAYFGINDMREVEKRYLAGDAEIVPVYEAMCYNISKFIGSMAVALEGKVDAIVITGGIAYDKNLVDLIAARVGFIAPVMTIPGEDEMKALAQGVLRVLNGEEEPKSWKA